MAFYDSGVTWDSGARWDEALPGPQHQPHKTMAQVKLNLRNKSDAELLTFGEAHATAIDGNANFPTPDPDAADFTAATTAYQNALTAQANAEAAAQAATAAKDTARLTYEGVLNDRGLYVQQASSGDEEKILSASFEVRDIPTAIGDLPAPVDFLATMGDMPGEIDFAWSPVKGASVYMVECKVHNDAGVWQLVKPFTASKGTATGLTSGTAYAFRVAAVGAAGQGPWSDESVKMAP